METATLKKFARFARRSLMEQVAAKLSLVLAEHSAARRENANAVEKLEKQIKDHGEDQVVEQVAYIWFNRFCALRFMDANRYTRMGVASPAPGQLQPEILAEAKMGHIDPEIVREPARRQKIRDLLDGKAPSRDPQGEAYRLLLTAACNYWQKAMPFLFERIADYTELLMPDDLLSANSILTHTREAMTEDICKDVEAIGWLYQFYISEKKDEVFAGLKKNQKITPENIPAATQLFTPHWIVRYLVENSLGRLWMLNRPHSKLAERMDYYIKPEQEETDFLRVETPEEITVCDPACGSGHMLTYAFDLLYAIYEEEGYNPAEIPEKILTHNLYGMEIDKRAGQLAAFALTMKARARQRRFFERGVEPNVCVLEKIDFEGGELEEYMNFVGRDLFTISLQATLTQLDQIDNFGSLIRPEITDVEEIFQILKSKNISEELFLSKYHKKLLQKLEQIAYLVRKYHVVITNPPYMGSKNMNADLKDGLKNNYTNMKSDLFSGFVFRCSTLGKQFGYIGIMSPNVWMYISTHESLRRFIIEQKKLLNLVELPLSGFKGATVQICAYNFQNTLSSDFEGSYIRLVDFKGGDEEMATYTQEAIKNSNCDWFYRVSAENFSKISGNPIAYWLGNNMIAIFGTKNINEFFKIGSGLSTSDNERFVRFIWEVSRKNINRHIKKCDDTKNTPERWYLFQKGGGFRKYYGNLLYLVNWKYNGREIKNWVINNPLDPNTMHWSRRIFNTDMYFKKGITWSTISSEKISFRLSQEGTMISNAAGGIFGFNDNSQLIHMIESLNTNVWIYIVGIMNPTLNYSAGIIQRVPMPKYQLTTSRSKLISIAKSDWDSYEISWDFSTLSLLVPNLIAPPPRDAHRRS